MLYELTASATAKAPRERVTAQASPQQLTRYNDLSRIFGTLPKNVHGIKNIETHLTGGPGGEPILCLYITLTVEATDQKSCGLKEMGQTLYQEIMQMHMNIGAYYGSWDVLTVSAIAPKETVKPAKVAPITYKKRKTAVEDEQIQISQKPVANHWPAHAGALTQ